MFKTILAKGKVTLAYLTGNPGGAVLKGVARGVDPTDAVNKAQFDEGITSSLEGNNNDFTGTNTFAGTTALNGDVTLAAAKKIKSAALATTIVPFYTAVAQQALSGAGAVDVLSHLTAFTSTGAAQALTLANGTQIGQLKRIKHVVDGGSGVLTPTSLSGGTTITFTTVGEQALLIWNGTAWVALELTNETTAGTPPVLA